MLDSRPEREIALAPAKRKTQANVIEILAARIVVVKEQAQERAAQCDDSDEDQMRCREMPCFALGEKQGDEHPRYRRNQVDERAFA